MSLKEVCSVLTSHKEVFSMRLRLSFAVLLLVVGCSSSQHVERADEAELNRSAGSAPDEGAPPTASEGTRASHRTSTPITGPLIETSCQATDGNSNPFAPACAVGCMAR